MVYQTHFQSKLLFTLRTNVILLGFKVSMCYSHVSINQQGLMLVKRLEKSHQLRHYCSQLPADYEGGGKK